MMSEEDVIPLVMEGDGSAPAELRLVVEQRPQHAPHRQPKSRAEVVEDYLTKENMK